MPTPAMLTYFLATLKKIPLALFLAVLLLHGVVVWWMLGTTVELPDPAYNPIIVTLEKADSASEIPEPEKNDPALRSE